LPSCFAFRRPMNKKIRVFIVALILVVSSSALIFSVNLQNLSCTQNFSFQDQTEDSQQSNVIYFSVPNSVNEYFQGLNHYSFDNRSFSKFVTPELFTKIAYDIKNTIVDSQNEDEIFANLVLDFVHGLDYKKSALKFAVETLTANNGDCDSLSFLTASIMKAGGLDVVLFLYENQSINHMNVGVNLPEKPLCGSNKTNVFFYRWDEKNYFVAETTGKSWQVGRQPENYLNSTPKIIPVNDFSKSLFEPISTRLNFPLKPSDLKLNIEPALQDGKISETIDVYGSLDPKLENQEIVVLVKHESSFDMIVESAFTDKLGTYRVSIDVNKQGKYSIQSVWMGHDDFSASESQKMIVNIGLSNRLDECEVIRPIVVADQTIQFPTLNDVGKRILKDQPVKTLVDKNFSKPTLNLQTLVTIFGNDESYFTKQDVIVPAHKEQFFDGQQIVTETVPAETIELHNYRDKLHSQLLLSFHKIQNELNFKAELYDRSKAQELMEQPQSKIVDVSNFIKENIEYDFIFQLDDDQVFLQFLDEEQTLYTEKLQIDFSKELLFGITFSYDPDSIPSLIVQDDSLENMNNVLRFNF